MDSKAQQNWQKVVAQYQQFCLLKRQGNVEDADQVLEKELPRKIAAWSHSAEKEQGQKKTDLEQMFRSEQQRMDGAWALNELIVKRWQQELLPQMCAAITREVQRAVSQQFTIQEIQQAAPPPRTKTAPANRLPFDDIPGIIDLLCSEERNEVRTRRPVCV